jgi:hypothetical protein
VKVRRPTASLNVELYNGNAILAVLLVALIQSQCTCRRDPVGEMDLFPGANAATPLLPAHQGVLEMRVESTVVGSRSDVTGVLPYDPRTHPRLSFSAARKRFREGQDTPRALLSRAVLQRLSVASRKSGPSFAPTYLVFVPLLMLQPHDTGQDVRFRPWTGCRSASKMSSRRKTCRRK